MHAECTKFQNCKCCALRGSLNLIAPNCKLCCLSLPQFYWKSNDTFYCLTTDSLYVLSTSTAHFGISFAYFWFWIPRNKPNKDSTEALARKASDWSGRCQRGLGNLYIATSFLSALRFWKFQAKLLLNVQLWLLDLTPVHFYRPDIANSRRRYFLMHVVTSRNDCWIDCTLLY